MKKQGKKRHTARASRKLLVGIGGGIVLAAALAVGLWLGLAEPLPPMGPEEGKLAPDFTLEDMEGNPFTLSDLRGRPVLLYFWQTNCPDCRVVFPDVIELFQLYEDQGLELVTVSLDHDEDTLREYLEENVPAGPVNLWGSYEAAMDVIDLYGMPYVPHGVLIDERGIIRSRGTHPRMPTEFDIEDIL
ncbi:MAG: redoxin domain-containing protein [Candidatus Bipolaricaulota bacterium]